MASGMQVSFFLIFSLWKGLRVLSPKWPPTKMTLNVMNNSCAVPLIETAMEIGDRHCIWGLNVDQSL